VTITFAAELLSRDFLKADINEFEQLRLRLLIARTHTFEEHGDLSRLAVHRSIQTLGSEILLHHYHASYANC
jgi:hypothetical protein